MATPVSPDAAPPSPERTPAWTPRRLARGLRRRVTGFDPETWDAQVHALDERVSRQDDERDRLEVALGKVSDELAGLRRDQEAVTEQQRAVGNKLDDVHAELETVRQFGKTLSSARGWAGAAQAYDELLFVLHDLRRQVRDLTARETPLGTDSAPTGGPAPASDPYAGRHPRRFDYLGFERRFRGSVEDVTKTLIDRYADELEKHGPVLDLGCGRGELIAELAARGVEVVGVEPHEPTAAEAAERGITVLPVTAAEFLRDQPEGSFGAIITLQVVEHLVVDDLIEMLELSSKVLRPGGVFVAETPNPMTILTMHESYILDPTHIQPIHPALLGFLAERAGFTRTEVRYHAPASTLWFEHVSSSADPELAAQVNTVIDRLNHQLYGPQDYALWAYTREAASLPEPAGDQPA